MTEDGHHPNTENRNGNHAADQLRAMHDLARLVSVAPNLVDVLMNTSDGMVICDPAQPDCPIIFANPQMRALTGYRIDELVGVNWRILEGASTDSATLLAIEQHMAAGAGFHTALLHYRKSGEIFWNDMEIRPAHDHAGRLVYWVAIMRDTTHLAFIRNNDSRAVLEHIHDHLEMGVVVLDHAHRIMRCNESLARLFGYDVAELLNRPVGRILPPELFRAVVSHHLPQREWYIRRRDNSTRAVSAKLTDDFATGHARWRILFLLDITERKEVERDLLRARDEAEVASRAKSSFLATMSHELRTPLNAIIGFSEIIESQMMGPVGTARYSDYAGDIHRSAIHLLEIINTILDISKIEAGRLDLHEDAINLADMIAECLHVVQDRAQRNGIRLVADIPVDLPLLHADQTKMRQILLNLLSNSVKFTPDGGMVAARCWLDEHGQIVVSISDSGIGMAPDEIALAMEPFGQVNSAFARRFDGTGLGLPLTKALVGLHDAVLHIESTRGKGTSVRIIFPQYRTLNIPTHRA